MPDLKLDWKNWYTINVTPSTLLKKKCYAGDWGKAIKDGWRFNPSINKFYKLFRKKG